MSGNGTARRLQAYLWELAETVMQAPTQQEIDQRVCEGLLSRDRFDSVWICDSPPESTPRTAAGRPLDEIEALHAAFEDRESAPPWARAADQKETVAQSVPTSVRSESATLGCVPLHHRRINYGVLVVTTTGDAENDMQRAVETLASFGQTVGHALATGEMQTHGEIFRQAIEQAEPAFAILDDEGTVEYANAGFESTFGYTKSDVIGSALEGYVEGVPMGLIADVRSGRPWRDEVVCYRKDGREIHVDLSVAAVPIEGGTRLKYVAVGTDITPIREREQRLQVLNRVLRHNLRNDIDAIRSYIEIAAQHADQPVGEWLDSAVQTTRDLLATAETSRNVQTTLAETDLRRQDIVAVLERVLGRVREEYPGRDVQITASESTPVNATRGLADALWELLENACVHARGTVQVTVAAEDAAAVVEISDHGPGIPEHELAVIESGEETPLEHGSGLGLWFAYWVIRASRGQLAFEVDDGTTVRISLPVAED